jgi:plasmid maintenance system antidote protein VapI
MPDLERAAARPIAREPTHPGELMREILKEHFSISISEAARRMDISRPAL